MRQRMLTIALVMLLVATLSFSADFEPVVCDAYDRMPRFLLVEREVTDVLIMGQWVGGEWFEEQSAAHPTEGTVELKTVETIEHPLGVEIGHRRLTLTPEVVAEVPHSIIAQRALLGFGTRPLVLSWSGIDQVKQVLGIDSLQVIVAQEDGVYQAVYLDELSDEGEVTIPLDERPVRVSTFPIDVVGKDLYAVMGAKTVCEEIYFMREI